MEHSSLAGLVFHIGTIMLLTTFRNKGLTIPSLPQIKEIPETLSCNISSLAALQWQLDPSICECALRSHQYYEINFAPFSITDVLHMAITLHRKSNQKCKHAIALKDSAPFIKAVKQKLIKEEADHFTQMVEGHALVIFQGLSPLINKSPIPSYNHGNLSEYQKLG